MNISLEEAKAMMTPESINQLKDVVTEKVVINTDKKMNNDILMQALCKAVSEEIIKPTSLNSKIIKLLNSETNTLSQAKLGEILNALREKQPNLHCVITLLTSDMNEVLQEWVFTGPVISFNAMFEYVVEVFSITPNTIREKLSLLLKPTIANNIAQFLVRYEMSDDKSSISVSINTITRLVNMQNHILMAEFKEL